MAITGTHLRSLDEKQRLAVPKRFRDALVQGNEITLFMAPETDRSLGLFGREVFERRAARLAETSGPAAHIRNYMRLYYSQAEEVEIDSQGRIRVPERLVEFARLRQEVVLLGVHDHVEVWDKELWDQFLTLHGTEFDRLATEAFEPGVRSQESGVRETDRLRPSDL
jgi:MraZ protein